MSSVVNLNPDWSNDLMAQSLNSTFIPGPTYAEMLDPAMLPAALRDKAVAAPTARA